MENSQLKHWTLERDAEAVLWLHLNQEGVSTNVLSREVVEELETVLDRIAEDPPRAMVLLSDKKGFIAGADIREFTQIENSEQALALIRRGQGVAERIEALPFPTAAMISGHCLGGGLELALACRYRVAEQSPATRIGLPEVRLGIHPGFGGTMRLTRLLGPVAAMELMLSGSSVDARRARRLGLVDYAVADRQLRRAARSVVLDAPAPRRPSLVRKMAAHRWVRPLLARAMRHQVARRARPEDYPAPYALIDLWRRYGGDEKAMLTAEGESVARLVAGSTSKNLVRTFFLQERLKSQSREAPGIARVHVIGAGRMGGDIAAWCAMQGMRVTLQDRTASQIGPALKRARKLFEKRLREPHRVTGAMDRLLPDTKGFGIAGADLVIEAVFEDLKVKHELLRTVEPRMRDGALLATNTSSLPLESLSEALERPERLVGLHFFNPVAKMPLVEVVHAAATDPTALARANAFVRSIDRLPLPVKSAPGFLVNRILMPYLLEAMLLAEEGVPVEAIDRAAVDFGMPMGPLRLADTVGLDVCLAVARVLAPHTAVNVPDRLAQWVAEGRLGEKSGRGFYNYAKGRARAPKGRVRAAALPEITDRLLFSMLRECLDCLREGVVEDADLLDAGMLFGTGFPPFRGGPMHYLSHQDPSVLQRRLEALNQAHGARFSVDLRDRVPAGPAHAPTG